MQTDWGGGCEYKKLSPFFTRIGISHLVSCPHTHQQNGSAECKHRHIVKIGLALLANASMPLEFWDEAFLTASFLINRLPLSVLNFVTPLEKLFSTKPDYSLLRTFGCACWPNLCPYNNHKLSFHSKKCAFLGYSTHHKGYKCLDIAPGRIYISRDVVFDESVFPFAALRPNACARLRAEISLLPFHLQSNAASGVLNLDTDLLPTSSHRAREPSSVQVPSSADPSPDHVVMLLGSSYFLRHDADSSTNPPAALHPGTASAQDAVSSAVLDSIPGSASDRLPSLAAPDLRQPDPAPLSPGPASLQSDHAPLQPFGAPAWGPPSPPIKFPAPASPVAWASSVVTSPAIGSTAAPSSTLPAEVGSPSPESMVPVSPIQPPRTRLQNNIWQPKKLFPGMIRYGNFCSTGEPESFKEAMPDLNWKRAMDEEFFALQRNGTWHLVPASHA